MVAKLPNGNVSQRWQNEEDEPNSVYIAEIELFFFFATVKCDIGSSSGVVFKRHQGVKLQNYVIKTLFPGSSVIACLKVCADIQECFSVNYFVPNGLCELNSYNYMMSDPIDAAGYIWYPFTR